MKTSLISFLALIIISFSFSCTNSSKTESAKIDTTASVSNDSALNASFETTDTSTLSATETKIAPSTSKVEKATIYVYNFHVTNRCVSCIAIEEATTKALNNNFQKELKEGRIKRQIIDVDKEANQAIAEKYEIFGSGLLIVRSFKGKETKVDLTGDGFKYAKNKEDKFIEIVKNKIAEFLK